MGVSHTWRLLFLYWNQQMADYYAGHCRFSPKAIIFAQFVLCPAYKWRCRKSQLKPKDFLWKRLEVTSLRKGSKSPFFRIGYLLKNISKQFDSFPKNRRSRSRNSYILFLLHLQPGLFAVQFTTYIMFISMTSLFAHKVAKPTKWRFLPKNLSQLVIFVIGLAFTWVWGDKNRAQF